MRFHTTHGHRMKAWHLTTKRRRWTLYYGSRQWAVLTWHRENQWGGSIDLGPCAIVWTDQA